jgi:hypothetical protein
MNLPSALRPVVHDPEVPVPQLTETLENASTNSSDSGTDDEEFRMLEKVMRILNWSSQR